MFAIIDTEARKCTATNSHDISPPPSCAPGQTRGVYAIEFASNHPLGSVEKLKEGEAAYKTTVTESQQAKEKVTNIAQLQEQKQQQQQQTTSQRKTQDTKCLSIVYHTKCYFRIIPMCKPYNFTLHSNLVHIQDEEALYDAADRGDVSAVRQLIARYVNVNCKSHQVLYILPITLCITIVGQQMIP